MYVQEYFTRPSGNVWCYVTNLTKFVKKISRHYEKIILKKKDLVLSSQQGTSIKNNLNGDIIEVLDINKEQLENNNNFNKNKNMEL